MQIQDSSRARKRRRAAPVEDRARAESTPSRPLPSLRDSLGVLTSIVLLQGCTGSPVTYGVGNDLASHQPPPFQEGIVITDATPPGILDAMCAGDLATCSVSWTNDIFPNMESTGAWHCATSGCHAAGVTPPAINDGDPTGAYASLATYTGFSPPYIVPCNTSASACSILCNLTPNGCGSPMPLAPGTPATTDQLSMIQTWIACGSPPN